MSESKKYLDFVTELGQLCIKHDVKLRTSGYDLLELVNAEGRPGIYCAGIDDLTSEDTELLQSLGDK